MSRPWRCRRGRSGVAVALVVGALVVVGASATASRPADTVAAQAAAFDRAYAAYQGWFVGERDEQGTRYEHWRYRSAQGPTGDRQMDSEVDYARMGRGTQVTLLRRDRLARPGFSLDYLHPAGSDVDLVLIGDRYRQPVNLHEGKPPAPVSEDQWIARPTTLTNAGSWDPCATAGTGLFCSLEQALRATRAAVPGVPRSYQQTADGHVTARTAIRLRDLVAYDIAPTNATQLAVLQPVLDTLIPFTITFGPDGRFGRAELNGSLAAPEATIGVQLGLETHGPASAADFPAPPEPAQVRQVSALEYVLFLQAAEKLQNLERAGEAAPPR